jgi:ubiquitin-like 1-activating enzyme E1 B
VGAGGIGCELLKNLALLSDASKGVKYFQEIHVVDLDMIDISNLNRQFLFQKPHVGQAKSLVAAESIRRYRPNTSILAHRGDIKDTTLFPPAWFASFDIVFNALDNMEARRHVNHMCCLIKRARPLCMSLAREKISPGSDALILIESATEGYQGQASVIQRGRFECFDCVERPSQRTTYPVCTIRSTPSALIHCIVWAKDYLFFNLFGETTESFRENMNDAALTGLAEEEKVECHENFFRHFRDTMETLCVESRTDSRVDHSRLLTELFIDTIEHCYRKNLDFLISMKDLWESRKEPQTFPFSREDLHSLLLHGDLNVENAFSELKEHLKRLKASFLVIMEDFLTKDAIQLLSFDKDNEAMMEFVYAAASLRACLFHIPRDSPFKVKGSVSYHRCHHHPLFSTLFFI